MNYRISIDSKLLLSVDRDLKTYSISDSVEVFNDCSNIKHIESLLDNEQLKKSFLIENQYFDYIQRERDYKLNILNNV